MTDKKAFQSNANRPFSNSLYFIMNTFDYLQGAYTVRSKFEHVVEGRRLGLGQYAEGAGVTALYRGLDPVERRCGSGPCTGTPSLPLWTE